MLEFIFFFVLTPPSHPPAHCPRFQSVDDNDFQPTYFFVQMDYFHALVIFLIHSLLFCLLSRCWVSCASPQHWVTTRFPFTGQSLQEPSATSDSHARCSLVEMNASCSDQ